MSQHNKYNTVALVSACAFTILLGLSAAAVAKTQSSNDHHVTMMKNHVLTEINARLDSSGSTLVASKISGPHGAFSDSTFQTRLADLKAKIENDANMKSLSADMNTLNITLHPPHPKVHR